MAACVTVSVTVSVIALLVALDTDYWPPRWPGTEPTTTITTTVPATTTTTTVPTSSPPFSEEELDFINAYAVLRGLDLRVSGQGIHDGGVFTPWLSELQYDWEILDLVLTGKTWCSGGADDELRRLERVEEDPDTTESRRAMAFAALAYLC